MWKCPPPLLETVTLGIKRNFWKIGRWDLPNRSGPELSEHGLRIPPAASQNGNQILYIRWFMTCVQMGCDFPRTKANLWIFNVSAGDTERNIHQLPYRFSTQQFLFIIVSSRENHLAWRDYWRSLGIMSLETSQSFSCYSYNEYCRYSHRLLSSYQSHNQTALSCLESVLKIFNYTSISVLQSPQVQASSKPQDICNANSSIFQFSRKIFSL